MNEKTPEKRDFVVRWQMDISATSPQEAAEKALAYIVDPESSAKVFDVIHVDDTGNETETTIDLFYGES